jgi:hypothetical protein
MTLEDKKSEYFNSVRQIFPELAISSSSSIYSGDAPTSARIELSNQSKAFKNRFSYSGSLIHYTSLDSLMNILNSQEVRLFNCRNLNDKMELGYAVKELGIEMSKEELELQRQNFFIFSACEYDPKLRNDDFNLWRLYSNSGYGAAIVFEITNLKDEWSNVFYGKVCYGTDSELHQNLINFIEIHQNFNTKYRLFENIPSIIPAIGLHFKNRIWSIENEIRLIAFCPYDKYTLESAFLEGENAYLSQTIKHTINKSGKHAAYVSLPLNIDHLRKQYTERLGEEEVDKYLQTIPHLKIKKVILGHKVPVDTIMAISRILEQSFSKSVGYRVEIDESSFREVD